MSRILNRVLTSPPKRNDAAEGLLESAPEMALFPTPEARSAAAARYARSFTWLEVLLGGLFCLVAAVSVLVAILYIVPKIIPGQAGQVVARVLMVVGAIGTQMLTLRWLYLRSGRPALRRELLACGVPVCMACGYALRGLPPTQERCPECGVRIAKEARELLRAA